MYLEPFILEHIKANYICTNSVDDLVSDICHRYYIDDAATINALYRKVKEYHPHMTEWRIVVNQPVITFLK